MVDRGQPPRKRARLSSPYTIHREAEDCNSDDDQNSVLCPSSSDEISHSSHEPGQDNSFGHSYSSSEGDVDVVVEPSFNPSRVKTIPTASVHTLNVPPPQTNFNTFASLGISLPLQAALSSMSIRMPTEIQVACIPPLLSGISFFSPLVN